MEHFADPLIGHVLDGRYRIDRHLDAGAMGTVYVAHQLSLGLDRAIKLVRADVADLPRRTRRFEREAAIIKQLRDPHTVQLIDQGQAPDGRLYLVYELLHGETLARRLARGPLRWAETLDVMAAVCQSLREAHRQGIIHRDLKPANLFIASLAHREIVKVLDFGVARWVEGSLTTGGLLGTPAYMAPEQALALPVDGRSDLYSLGVVAYHCLAGVRPFVADNPAVTLSLHVHVEAVPLSVRAPDVPPAVAVMVMRLLAKRPDDRHPDADALAAEIEALRRSLSPLAMPPAVPSERGLAATVSAAPESIAPVEVPIEPLAVTETATPAAPVQRSSGRGAGARLAIGALLLAGLGVGWWAVVADPPPAGGGDAMLVDGATLPRPVDAASPPHATPPPDAAPPPDATLPPDATPPPPDATRDATPDATPGTTPTQRNPPGGGTNRGGTTRTSRALPPGRAPSPKKDAGRPPPKDAGVLPSIADPDFGAVGR